MFEKRDDKDAHCQYVARYVCNCNPKRAIVIIDVRVTNHKEGELAGLYLFGEHHEPHTVQFCPGCGTSVPTAEAILLLEGLKHE